MNSPYLALFTTVRRRKEDAEQAQVLQRPGAIPSSVTMTEGVSDMTTDDTTKLLLLLRRAIAIPLGRLTMGHLVLQ